MTIACPTDDELAGHLAGDVAASRAAAVGAHLDTCAACREVVVGALRGGVVSLADVSAATASARLGVSRARAGAVLAPGTEVGRYRVERLLGAGGMGVVYVAHDTALDRRVALKVLRSDLAGNPEALAERLFRESRLMAKARHPCVITVHDVGRDGDRVFVAMDLIEGETLGTWLRRRPRTVADVVAIFRRAGEGLAAAHRAGLIHRDFKPENVLIELEGEHVTRVLVTDFGVARALAEDADAAPGEASPGRAPDLTATGVAVGTPAYMAPEQLSGQDVDERADVFGFAVALWEALYGQRPFAGATPAEIRQAMTRPPLPPIDRPAQAARGRVPGWIQRALLAALVADRAARTPTVNALLAALDPGPRRRRWQRLAAAATAVVLGGGAWLGIAAWPTPATGPSPCADGLAELAYRWGPARAAQARTALGHARADAEGVAAGIMHLDERAAAWTALHQRTCKAQPGEVAACLAARRLELGAIGDEMVIASPAATEFPDKLPDLVGDPAQCATLAPALLQPRVPTDPALQRAVADLRRRIFALEAVRDDVGEYAAALAAIPDLERDARATGWDMVIAEVLYLRGSIEMVGTDTAASAETLREAAVVAQRAHYDQLAASAWIVLAHTTAIDLHEGQRAFEYLDYAQAAAERIGSARRDVIAQLLYTRGLIELDAGRFDDGEAHMREALAIAETEAPEYLSMVVSGLGYALEERGRYLEAAAQYQRALELHLAKSGDGHANEVVYRGRLAFNLSHAGKIPEALTEAEAALVVAEATLDEKHIDRMHAHVGVAEVLRMAGRHAEALASIDRALGMAEAIFGKREQLYGEVLQTRANLLHELGRSREAIADYARACEILAFTAGDDSLSDALCRLEGAMVLIDVGRAREALAVVEAELPVVERVAGAGHVQAGMGHMVRGDALSALGRIRDAAAAYEAARAIFAAEQVEVGFLAATEWGLAQVLEKSEPERAALLARSAVERWEHAVGMWEKDAAAARAWLAKRR